MKNTKKLFALMLAVLMLLSVACCATAEDSTKYQITVKNENEAVSINGKMYSAYRLFAATYSTETSAISYFYDPDTCVEVKYTPEGGSTELSGEALLEWLGGASTDDARKFADEIQSQLEGKPIAAYASATDEEAIIDVKSAGYYVVTGSADNINGAEGKKDVVAAVSLTAAKPDATINPKLDAPSLDKKIKHNESDEWGNVGDNQIGDTVEYRTITTVPSIVGYKSYDYVIHDVMDPGLTFNQDSVKIKIDDNVELDKSYYEVITSPDDECSFEIKVNIMEAMEKSDITNDSKLYTYYEATLNEKALIYDVGHNDNTAYLSYSNDPYNQSSTGETPHITVYDWTFEMNINKVDNNKTPLTGAKFVLSDKDVSLEELDLDESGMPTVKDGLIPLVAIEGGYRVATDGDPNKVYVIDAGKIKIDGLDDSTDYYLREIKAPDGYNLLKDAVKFNISCEYNEQGDKYENTPTVRVNNDDVSTELATDVVNQSGATLPETGGIGTTIFYVAGGVLVLLAVVLLVTKRRVGEN